MAALIGMPRAAWRRQPNTEKIIVDPEFRVSSAFLPFPGMGYDYANNIPNSSFAINSFTRKINAYGTAVRFNNVARAAWYTRVTNSQYKFTFVICCVPDSAIGASRLITNSSNLTILGGGNDSNIFEIYYVSTRVIRFSFPGSIPQTIVMVFNTETSGNQPMIFINGGRISLTVDATPSVLSQVGVAYAFGNNYDLDRAFFGEMNAGFFFEYAIDESIAQSLSINPWQIFKRHIARFISIPSSGPVTFQPAWARSRSLIIGSGV